MRSLIMVAVAAALYAQSPGNTQRTITTEADFRKAMKELSNWGRWGSDDELGGAARDPIRPSSL